MTRAGRVQFFGSILFIGMVMLMMTVDAPALGVTPMSDEMTTATQWVQAHLTATTASLPFSFVYDGQPSGELLGRWKGERSSERLDENRTRHTIKYAEPAGGLALRCEAMQYHDYPTVEWTIAFANTGTTETRIIENIQALDTRLTLPGPAVDCGYLLHQMRGTVVVTPVMDVPAGERDYEPYDTRLAGGRNHKVMPAHGRPLAGESPYFNIEMVGQQRGVIVALGWLGRWEAEFNRPDGGPELRIRAGQELTHFRLHPGEEARTPLVVMQFWQGDRVRSQNIWRRWMQAHNMPRPGGQPFPPATAGVDCMYVPGLVLTEAIEKEFIDRFAEEKIQPDYWWIDAGWYKLEGILAGEKTPLQDYSNTGTWEVDPARFPHGLRGVFDEARAKGIPKSMVWFEMERVRPGSWLDRTHPEWLFKCQGDPNHRLLNFGNPEAWRWATDRVSQIIEENGLDVYRQDFNFDPLPYWRENDAPDRQGLNEIKHVTGLLAFYKELLRRHPNLLIDNCASGSHRNDVESLRYMLPLWRSDCPWDPIAQQGQTYGFSFWEPYYGVNIMNGTDVYAMRSGLAPFMSFSWDMRRKDLNFDAMRQLQVQWRQIADCYLGDYYPLTSYSVANDAWMAWQFDSPEAGKGLVQAFRRPESPFVEACFRLHGLVAESEYEVRNLDEPEPRRMSGRQLMDEGLPLRAPDKATALIITYRKAQ